ncbi:ATPase [Bacteroidetes bacterium UKL13-3]|nr:ATPase [Bacteroidetes bacterium UKL13-3]HCP93855.1 ATPase [Bacteroidota bacterium]
MNTIKRSIEERLKASLIPNKVIVLVGARRIGKTSLVKSVLKDLVKEKVLQLNGEDMATAEVLKQRTVENYKRLLGNYTVLVIDEAQKIEDIGSILKLMVDEIPGIKILVTGSSMFDLTNKLGEPLTGRKRTFELFPLAQMEYQHYENLIQTKAGLAERLIYGSYPELLQYPNDADKSGYLKQLVNDYLLKDILAFEGVRNASKMFDLLRLIAFQVGKEVSLDELGRQLGMSKNTVEKYLDLLTKVFVIYKVKGFSRNLRSEIVKSNKWYFYDNGIRNVLIANFAPLTMRADVGELWENYCLAERLKFQQYTDLTVNNYFWRTYQQQEIDWVEERDGKLFAYELKWNADKKIKVPSAWKTAYPEAGFEVIHPGNYLDWITA